MFAYGPIILFPRTLFTWKIKAIQDITSDSLSMMTLLEPKLDLLIIGVEKKEMTRDISKNILEITHQNKINVEILSTEMACNQFNHLSTMGKMVAAALIPPKILKLNSGSINTGADDRIFTVDGLDSPDVKDALKKEKEFKEYFKPKE